MSTPPSTRQAKARHLFVYGTLRSAFRNPYARLLAQESVLLGPARLRGRLYQLGNYPGMLAPLAPQDWVTGELYQISTAPGLLSKLDEYEGPEFERVLARAHRSGRSPVKTWVYLFRGQVSEDQLIASGDYCA
jgi:gamma-glutamylcyclotransferase (GGCT)/AIG2-like uncharacterized protein YtfP